MLAFTKPTFTEEQREGLKGPSVSFAVSGASDLHYNEPAATLIDALIGGEWEEPELEGGPIPPTSEPARQLLGWVYRALKQAEWPVYQLAAFEPSGTGDLDGDYHFPTRISAQFLPTRLFRLLLNNTWLEPDAAWNADDFRAALTATLKMAERTGLKGSNQRWVLLELLRRGQTLTEIMRGIYQVGEPSQRRFIRGSVTDGARRLLSEIQLDKLATIRLLGLNDIPTTKALRVINEAGLFEVAERVGYPVVIKPSDGAQGSGVFCNVQDKAQLKTIAESYPIKYDTLILEKFIHSDSLRVTLYGERIIQIAIRKYPMIVGNGLDTVHSLIETQYERPFKVEADGYTDYRDHIKVEKFLEDPNFHSVLKQQGHAINTIPEKDEAVIIGYTSNYSVGATMRVIDSLSEDTLIMKAAKEVGAIFGSDVLGIDFLIPKALEDHDFVSLDDAKEFYVGEVNFGPGLNSEVSPAHFIDAFLADRSA